MPKYKKNFEIPFYDSDKNGNATPISILSYLGETSGAHTDKIGFGHQKISKLNYAWMINRWKVKIDKYPKVKDKITIETWTSGIDRFYATREFKIYDNEDNEIGRASTQWIFIDMIKKRPIRIPVEFKEIANPIDERLFDDYYKFEKNYITTEDIDFHVRRADIDYNNHVNNARYLSWMIEAIPQYIYEDYILEEFEILYKKEAKYGHTILSGINEQILDNCNGVFFHNIIDKESKENHAIGITSWKKINKLG